jgi:hypothetical protein
METVAWPDNEDGQTCQPYCAKFGAAPRGFGDGTGGGPLIGAGGTLSNDAVLFRQVVGEGGQPETVPVFRIAPMKGGVLTLDFSPPGAENISAPCVVFASSSEIKIFDLV